MTVPTAFSDACTARWFDFGRGPTVVRVEHPALPGRPVIGVVDPGFARNWLAGEGRRVYRGASR